MDKVKIEQAIRDLLIGIGEDPDREGLQETPKREAKMYAELLDGYQRTPAQHMEKQFTAEDSELVLVKDIPFHSMCEHHLLPFYGVGHIAYVPGADKVVGLSKLARILEDISLRLQLQEQITTEVAHTIADNLEVEGVFVVLEAEHMCMSIRGVHKEGASTVTKSALGCFKENSELRKEVLSMIRA